MTVTFKIDVDDRHPLCNTILMNESTVTYFKRHWPDCNGNTYYKIQDNIPYIYEDNQWVELNCGTGIFYNGAAMDLYTKVNDISEMVLELI